MKAVVCRKLGPPSALRLEDLPRPPLAADQVRIATRAAGVNFPDILMVAGRYQHKPPLPFVPGFEAAGEVIETGEAVRGLDPGARVIARLRTGGYAEEAVAPADALLPLPAAFSFVEGAAFAVAYATAYVGLAQRGRLSAGERLLVLGAAGGVGLAAVELGRHLGARVIAVVGGGEKAAAARAAGADVVVRHDREDVLTAVRHATAGAGVDLVYDPVGGDAFDGAVEALARGGRLVVVGFASGRIPTIAAARILEKELEIIGLRAGEAARRNPARGRKTYDKLLNMAAAGEIRPRIHQVLPLSAFREAMEAIVGRRAIGKVVLVP